MAEQEKDQAQTEQPADGPNEGGTSQDVPDEGGTTQDVPGGPDTSDKQTRVEHHPGAPADSNERADSRVQVVEPDGSPSPRA